MRRRDVIGGLGSFAGIAWAASWPARAQARPARVALLTLEVGEEAASLLGPLRDLGYVPGQTLAFEHRSAGGDPARLATLAAELVQGRPDVLVAGRGTLAPMALRRATSTIPIVFAGVGDPVGAGLAESLAHPGGNATGLSSQSAELKSKQLQLLLTAVPGQRVVGVLLNPDTPFSALAWRQLTAAAEAQGVRLEALQVRSVADLTPARMDALVAAGAGSLFVVEDPLTAALRGAVLEQTTRVRLPVLAALIEYGPAGALLTYGADQKDFYRRTADYVAKILRGAKPSDLPVEQATQFHLTVNQRAARALGVVVPASLLVAADEVID
jgi:putative ABC transport system substrate-binding protein